MYVPMTGEVASSSTVIIDNHAGKATNVNGYMQFRLSNKSKTKSDEFIKVDGIEVKCFNLPREVLENIYYNNLNEIRGNYKYSFD